MDWSKVFILRVGLILIALIVLLPISAKVLLSSGFFDLKLWILGVILALFLILGLFGKMILRGISL